MSYLLLLPILMVADASAANSVRGQYVEARTCDVFTGSCFANADTGLTGKHAVLAWKIDSGTIDGIKLDGLGVVAVVAASETLGLKQTSPSRAVADRGREGDQGPARGAREVREGPGGRAGRRSGRSALRLRSTSTSASATAKAARP